MKQEKIEELLENVLSENLTKKILKIIKNKGIEINKNPQTILKPRLKLKDGKIDSGKITLELKF